MKIKDFIKKDIDVDVYDNVTQEIIDISFVGPLELTEEGKEKFKEVLEYDVALYEEYTYAIVKCSDEEPKIKWITNLIGWLKRNQALKLIDITYDYGKVYFLPFLERNIQYLNNKGQFDYFSDYVDEVFHRQLLQCEKKERQWFLEHDEYSILKTKLRKAMEKHSTTFEINIGYSSSGEVYIYDDSRSTKRPITIEEIKILLTQYKKLDNYTRQLSKEIEIVF